MLVYCLQALIYKENKLELTRENLLEQTLLLTQEKQNLVDLIDKYKTGIQSYAQAFMLAYSIAESLNKGDEKLDDETMESIRELAREISLRHGFEVDIPEAPVAEESEIVGQEE